MTPSPIALPFGLRTLRRVDFPHKLGIMDRLFGAALARHGAAWVETAAGPLWKLDLRSGSQRWIVYGDYEGPTFIPWARRWLRDGDVVIDSGANIGQTLLYFATAADVRVLAFEPNPHARIWLQECLGVQKWNVEVVPCGLGAAPASLELKLPHFEGEADAQATLHADWYLDCAADNVTVAITTMDDVLRERNIERVRLWKIDVEGWEYEALRGAKQSLHRRAFDAIFVELLEQNAAACTVMLEDAGYELYRIRNGGRLVRGAGQIEGVANVLALPVTASRDSGRPAASAPGSAP